MNNTVYGREKLAQTGMKFLAVSMDARASAMGDAQIAVSNNSVAMFYNPSTMARFDKFVNFSVGQLSWIADINYLYGSFALRPAQGQWGVFGVTFQNVDYGALQGTIRAEGEQGYLDIGEFTPSAYALGFGYAKSLTDRFSVGGHAKYVFQNLVGGLTGFDNQQASEGSDFNKSVWAFDFGVIYATGFKSLNLGMSLKNFSEEIKYVNESFQLPLIFEIGVSMDINDLMQMNPEQHQFLVAIDATHPRDWAEQIDLGVEYIFMKTFSLRMGYSAPRDEQNMHFGAGFQQGFQSFGMNIDYAYTPFGVFEDVHRISFQFSY
jgi:hypothetical protein